MSLSDQLLRLSEQAKDLESSADALRTNNAAHIEERKLRLEASIENEREQLGNTVADAGDAAAAEWAAQKLRVSDRFQEIRDRSADRHARRTAQRAEHAAEVAENDALDEIDFAIYSIQEAEYSILDAASARATADELRESAVDD